MLCMSCNTKGYWLTVVGPPPLVGLAVWIRWSLAFIEAGTASWYFLCRILFIIVRRDTYGSLPAQMTSTRSRYPSVTGRRSSSVNTETPNSKPWTLIQVDAFVISDNTNTFHIETSNKTHNLPSDWYHGRLVCKSKFHCRSQVGG